MLRFYTLIFIFLFQNLLFSQSIKSFVIPDSLKNKTYEQLQKSYDKVFRIDNDKAEIFANTILLKGKKEKNNTLIYDGYYKIAHTKGLKSENGHPFADSLLTLTKNIDAKDYPAKAHIIKGILHNYEWQYGKALDHYMLAQKLSKNKNSDQFYYIKKLIGILKTATEENDEALLLFIEYYNYQKQKLQTDSKDIKSYIGSLFSVANSYSKNKQYKKALYYTDIGLKECNKYNDYTHYPYFISGVGIANYYLKNYEKSLNNHLIAEKDFIKNNDYGNLAITYYFLGKTYYETHQEKQAVKYFIKSDSVLSFSKEFYPITRDGYEVLIDYYKKIGDKENQLKYIDKLFLADKYINNSKQYLSKEIYKKYDTPILLEKKQKLINDLNNKTSVLHWILGIGSVIIIILIFLTIKERKKVKQYKKHAEILFSTSNSKSLHLQDKEIQKSDSVKEVITEKGKSSIPKNILEDLGNQLSLFEKNKDFLQKNITVDALAKKMGTNRDYLSKAVNEIKDKNFSQYINELRINYIVEELRNNEKLRKFTISAIADEIGFNNSESFSNAFKKVTGTLPSYYIKRLNKKEIK